MRRGTALALLVPPYTSPTLFYRLLLPSRQAFHVFKVFVANPKKPPEVSKILVDNKEKLVKYLSHFHADKDDEQFKEEKGLLIATLSKLEYAPPTPAAPAPAATAEAGGASS